MAALADLALHTQRLAGLSCTFECDQDVPVDNSHTATELFYIAQEAVRNAVKHASPRGYRSAFPPMITSFRSPLRTTDRASSVNRMTLPEWACES